MTPGKNRLFITCILTTLTITLLIPFAGRAGAQTDQPEERINRIALMPFLLGGSEAIKEHRLEKSLDCQLRGLCTLMDNLESNSGKTLTGIFKDELLKIYPYQLVPIAQSQQVYDSLSGKLNKTPRELAVELGKQLGADHVLGGLVWRFREREGNTMSVVQPASVSFSAYLIRVADGTVIWKDNFDKTQTSLSDNLFNAHLYLKEGMRWLTAEELAAYGANKMLKGLPGQ